MSEIAPPVDFRPVFISRYWEGAPSADVSYDDDVWRVDLVEGGFRVQECLYEIDPEFPVDFVAPTWEAVLDFVVGQGGDWLS